MPDDFVDRVRMHDVAHREGGGVPHRLLASWQRSEDYGVPLKRSSRLHRQRRPLLVVLPAATRCSPTCTAPCRATGQPDADRRRGVVLSRLSGHRGRSKRSMTLISHPVRIRRA